jgi:hypothetical protein
MMCSPDSRAAGGKCPLNGRLPQPAEQPDRPPLKLTPRSAEPLLTDRHDAGSRTGGLKMWVAIAAVVLSLVPVSAIANDTPDTPLGQFTKWQHGSVRYDIQPERTHVETHDWPDKVLAEQ